MKQLKVENKLGTTSIIAFCWEKPEVLLRVSFIKEETDCGACTLFIKRYHIFTENRKRTCIIKSLTAMRKMGQGGNSTF